MATFSERLTRLGIDVAWGQWATLGVSAAQTNAQKSNCAIDPEALIVFTGNLGDADPRLRDESTDWCTKYGTRFISGTRLKNLVRKEPMNSHLDEFLSTVNNSSDTRWVGSGPKVPPRSYEPSAKSILPAPRQIPALLRFHLRAIWGANTRSEVLFGLLTRREQNQFTASDFEYTSFSKRIVASVLDDFALAELVHARPRGNRTEFRLASSVGLHKLAPAAQIALFVRWDLRLSMLTRLVHFAKEHEHKSDNLKQVAAAKFLDENAKALTALQLLPTPLPRQTDFWQVALSLGTKNLVPRRIQ
jgi:hypothetical protein